MAVELSKAMIEVGVFTGDTERSLAFYRDFLGLPFVAEFSHPGGVQYRLAVGASILKINSSKENPKPPPVGPGGPLGGAGGFRYISFCVKNLEDVVSQAEQLGYKVVNPFTRFSPTVAFAVIEDPDGNSVELFQSE
jgi:predicted enzyme related to lactoylglutathione lyase